MMVFIVKIGLVNSQRWYACDKKCTINLCDEEDEKKVCTHIIEYDPDGNDVEFPNKCAFQCANKCYGSKFLFQTYDDA